MQTDLREGIRAFFFGFNDGLIFPFCFISDCAQVIFAAGVGYWLIQLHQMRFALLHVLQVQS